MPPPSDTTPPPGSETLDVGGWQIVVADGHAVLPDGMTHLPDWAFRAFSRCSALSSVNLPAGLTSIGDGAFYRCTSIRSIALPDSLTSIGDGAFAHCSALSSINLPAGLTSIGSLAFYDCSALSSVNLPAGLTSIGRWAFADCSALASVNLPASLTSIGQQAFDGCSALARVAFPAGLTSIGFCAFADCSALSSVNLPGRLRSIGDLAFCRCSSLASISLPAGLTSIGWHAFSSCSALAHVTVPTTAKFDASAFFTDTVVLRLPPAKMRTLQRWYEAVDLVLAHKRCRPSLLGFLERARSRLASKGSGGAARKRDREEFEGDFAEAAAVMEPPVERDRATTDRKLGAGSFDRGWRIREHYRGGAKSGLWSYVSPTGDAFSVALEAAEAIEDEAVAAAAAAAMAAAEAPQMEGSAAIAAADAVVAEAPSRPSPAPSSSKKRGGASERKKPRSPHRSPHLGWSPITEEQRTSLREEEEGWLGEFEAYFRGKLSHKNAQQVMKHLTPLVAGKGVNFGPGVGNFLAGIPVTLSSDVANILDALHAEGNAAVRDHDDLKGGWHLRHPLYKLREFQAHKLGMGGARGGRNGGGRNATQAAARPRVATDWLKAPSTADSAVAAAVNAPATAITAPPLATATQQGSGDAERRQSELAPPQSLMPPPPPPTLDVAGQRARPRRHAAAVADQNRADMQAMEQRSDEAWRVRRLSPESITRTAEVLGRGAHGVVYKGSLRRRIHGLKAGTPIALKRENTRSSEFHDEARLLNHCQSEYVLKVFGTYEDSDRHMIMVTELCERRSIADVFESDDCSCSVLPAHALSFMRQIAEAMKHLHMLGITHRDLKPDNVMVHADLSIRLGDFGQARQEANMMSNMPGSAYYMAPEALQGVDYRKCADVYSYAITCWEILEPSHTNAWPRGRRAQGPKDRPSLLTIQADAHELLRRCWHESPAGRPSFAALLVPGGLLNQLLQSQ